MSDLTSSRVPGRRPVDHVRGSGPEVIVYADFACPRCAASWPSITGQRACMVFRHFPAARKHPRAPTLHAAAEAAGRQERFWEFCDSLFEDPGRHDDPHLWHRAESLGLDLERFESDRRSDDVAARVRGDFEEGIRAGVVGTPALFVGGRLLAADPVEALRRALTGPGGAGNDQLG